MQIEYAPSFLRIFKKLETPVKEGVKETTRKIIDYYTTGQKTLGLGVRHLQKSIWEGRSGLQIRVIYWLGADRIKFLIAGTHNDVKRFLKNF